MKCRVCSCSNLDKVIDLGMQPWGNNFLKHDECGQEPFYPLRVLLCSTCFTAQLDYTVKKEVMFGNHTYLSGITKSLSAHFESVALSVDSRFFKNKEKKSILDIGSNDGTQLKHYKRRGWTIQGVESAKTIADIALESGIPTLHAFFNEDALRSLNKKYDAVNASGVFFHLEELHSVTRSIKSILDDNGVFIVQFLYIKSIMENDAFDQIYHEHLLYYSLRSLEYLLGMYELEIFDAELCPIHGGQMIAYVSHSKSRLKTERLFQLLETEDASQCNSKTAYLEFARRIEILREKNLAYLKDAKNKNKRVFGMGAPVKGNTLLNYFNIGRDLVECLLEKNRLRKGLFSPGMHLPILMEDETHEIPDIYYVLAWNFKKEIIENNSHLIRKGVEFYFPIDPS